MELTLTFYNVENLYDTVDDPGVKDGDYTPDGLMEWTQDRYHAKLDAIAEVLHATGSNGRPPAFIGLCEIENKQVLSDLVRRQPLSDTSYEIVHLETRDVRGIDVAFLFNRSIFEMEGRAALNFEELTEKAFGARDVLHIWGRLKEGPQPMFHFYVNHWPSRHGGEHETRFKREAAAQRLRREVDEIWRSDPEACHIIVGDFNDAPDDYTMLHVLGAGALDEAPQRLVNLGWPAHRKGHGTVFHEGDWYLFDTIIVSSNLLTNEPPYVKRKTMYIFSEGDTLFKEPRDRSGKPNRTYVGKKYKGGISDHLAVFCRLGI